MDRNGLVSVIIPTFNRREYLLEAVESVLNQTYRETEIVVVDDGSTDGSEDAIMRLRDSRVHYIWQKNTGLPAIARNAGIRSSRGVYIAFLDSDDVWLPQKLQRQVEYLERNTNTVLVGTNAMKYPNGKKMHLKITGVTKLSTRRLIRNTNELINSSVMVRRMVFDEIGFLNEEPALKASEDWEYWLRVSLKYSIVVLPDILLKYRIHEENLSATKKIDAKRQELYLKRYMNVLSRFNNFSWLKNEIKRFRKKQEKLIVSSQCREKYQPSLNYLLRTFKSKALFRTKIKIVSWYIINRMKLNRNR
jgi:glycosyltransferase involved in cell wall biosynthesis